MPNPNVEQILDEVREKCFQENEAMLNWNFGEVNVLPIVQDNRSKNQDYSWLVVTNSRLILFQPSFLGTSGVKYIPLKNIQSITLIEKWFDRTHLEILTHNEIIKVNALNPQDILHSDKKALLTKLLESINNAQRDSEKSSINIEHSNNSRFSNLDLIRNIEELYRTGILNQTEYEEKKSEILKRI